MMLATTLACACGGESGFVLGPEAQIDVNPTELIFGDVPRGEQARRIVTLRHVGTGGVIVLENIRLETDSPDLEVGFVESLELRPGGESRIQVVYNSDNDEPDSGELVINLNVASTQELRIPVKTPGQRAQLVASPGSVDFGVTQGGAPRTIDVTVFNVGTAAATLTDSEILADDDGDYSVEFTSDNVVEPDTGTTVKLTYSPTNQNKDVSTVRILTDREDVELEVPVADSTTMHVTHDAEHLPQELRGPRFREGRPYARSRALVYCFEQFTTATQVRHE